MASASICLAADQQTQLMEFEFEKKLIQSVKSRVCLTDRRSKQYESSHCNEVAWRNVSKEQEKSVVKCIDGWYTLVHIYKYYQHMRKLNLSKEPIKWPHFEELKNVQNIQNIEYIDLVQHDLKFVFNLPDQTQKEELINCLLDHRLSLLNPQTHISQAQNIWARIASKLNTCGILLPIIKWQECWCHMKIDLMNRMASIQKEMQIKKSTNIVEHFTYDELKIMDFFGVISTDSMESIKAVMWSNIEFGNDMSKIVNRCRKCSTFLDSSVKREYCATCFKYSNLYCDLCSKIHEHPTTIYQIKDWSEKAKNLFPRGFQTFSELSMCFGCFKSIKKKAAEAWMVCRVCESQDCLEYLYANRNEEMRKMFNNATKLQLSVFDGLPAYICKACYGRMLKFNDFYLTFSRTQMRLLKMHATQFIHIEEKKSNSTNSEVGENHETCIVIPDSPPSSRKVIPPSNQSSAAESPTTTFVFLDSPSSAGEVDLGENHETCIVIPDSPPSSLKIIPPSNQSSAAESPKTTLLILDNPSSVGEVNLVGNLETTLITPPNRDQPLVGTCMAPKSVQIADKLEAFPKFTLNKVQKRIISSTNHLTRFNRMCKAPTNTIKVVPLHSLTPESLQKTPTPMIISTLPSIPLTSANTGITISKVVSPIQTEIFQSNRYTQSPTVVGLSNGGVSVPTEIPKAQSLPKISSQLTILPLATQETEIIVDDYATAETTSSSSIISTEPAMNMCTAKPTNLKAAQLNGTQLCPPATLPTKPAIRPHTFQSEFLASTIFPRKRLELIPLYTQPTTSKKSKKQQGQHQSTSASKKTRMRRNYGYGSFDNIQIISLPEKAPPVPNPTLKDARNLVNQRLHTTPSSGHSQHQSTSASNNTRMRRNYGSFDNIQIISLPEKAPPVPNPTLKDARNVVNQRLHATPSSGHTPETEIIDDQTNQAMFFPDSFDLNKVVLDDVDVSLLIRNMNSIVHSDNLNYTNSVLPKQNIGESSSKDIGNMVSVEQLVNDQQKCNEKRHNNPDKIKNPSEVRNPYKTIFESGQLETVILSTLRKQSKPINSFQNTYKCRNPSFLITESPNSKQKIDDNNQQNMTKKTDRPVVFERPAELRKSDWCPTKDDGNKEGGIQKIDSNKQQNVSQKTDRPVVFERPAEIRQSDWCATKDDGNKEGGIQKIDSNKEQTMSQKTDIPIVFEKPSEIQQSNPKSGEFETSTLNTMINENEYQQESSDKKEENTDGKQADQLNVFKKPSEVKKTDGSPPKLGKPNPIPVKRSDRLRQIASIGTRKSMRRRNSIAIPY